MASNRNEHLRYRYGICLNDSCEKCKSKEVQQIPARKDLVCESCGKPLRECPPPKSFGQRYGKLIGICVAAAIIIAGALVFFLLPAKNGGSEEPSVAADSIAADTIIVSETSTTDTIIAEAVNDSLIAKAYADSLKLAMADSIIQAQNAAAQNTQTEALPEAAPAQPTATKATGATQSSHRLSYGTWSGNLKNGQPHGNGTMTYTTARAIDSRDPKGRVAQPGEYIVGEWDNGHLVQGRWFKNDGSKEAVIIGKAG